MDSLDVVELVMEFEKECNVDLPDAEAARLGGGTVGDAWRAMVRARTGAEPPPGAPPAADPTWRRVVGFVAERTGTPPDAVRWDAPLLGG